MDITSLIEEWRGRKIYICYNLFHGAIEEVMSQATLVKSVNNKKKGLIKIQKLNKTR